MTDLWIFGYGSLMWDPGFAFDDCVPCRLPGWHRQFALRSVTNWGSPDAPGLAAALYPGGHATGLAFRIKPDRVAEALAYLDVREASYLKRSVRLERMAGRPLEAVTFVRDPANPAFMPERRNADLIAMIRGGRGAKGSSLFYLESTVQQLDRLNSSRTRAHRLLQTVKSAP